MAISRTPVQTWKATTAGILTIIAGAINVIIGLVIAAVGGAFIPFGMPPWFAAISAPFIILGIVSILGGSFALKRRLWGLALAGAICALFPPYLIVLGLLSIIFLAMGKSEFA